MFGRKPESEWHRDYRQAEADFNRIKDIGEPFLINKALFRMNELLEGAYLVEDIVPSKGGRNKILRELYRVRSCAVLALTVGGCCGSMYLFGYILNTFGRR